MRSRFALLAVLAAGTPLVPAGAAAEHGAPAAEAALPDEPCSPVSERLRKLEAATREMIVQLREHRLKALEDAEGFGLEMFQPYMAELYKQEMKLQADLKMIQAIRCHGEQ
jgi:hypothetical protein